ncbi:MAG: lysophospholipase [Clostridia bacterium]|nr:lysophospholipase [Clostridia bacterium]
MEVYRIWSPSAAPRAIVQIVHGMAEHIDRYDRMAKALNEAGFLVCGRNHRGHGPEAELLGYFADKDGWEVILKDAHDVSEDVKKQHPGVPFFLLGHSMGSFLAREYALRYGKELDGLILSGTGFYPKALCASGRIMAKLAPQKKPANFVNNIAFAGNNKPFAPGRTGFEWLSRDEKEVDKYVADPLCGFCFTGSAFADFFGGLLALTDESRLSSMPKDLPVYFMSGDKDPVGQMGTGVRQVAEQFKKAGMKDITVKLYPDARHELFNELNREEVSADLTLWLNEHVEGT